jgi:hypothetical protein
MVKHIVFWKVNEEFDKEAICLEIKARLESLAGNIPGLEHIEVGRDFNNSPVAFDVALYSTLDSKEALENYQVHPLHEAAKAYIGTVTTERAVVDYEI